MKPPIMDKRLNIKVIRNLFFIWILIALFFFIADNIYWSTTARIVNSILTTLNYLFVFYCFNLFIFPRYWKKNHIFLILAICMCLVIYWGNLYLIYFEVVPKLGGYSFYLDRTLSFFLVDSIFLFFVFASSGVSFFLNRFSINKIKMQVEKEKAIMIKELKFLKDQFNSHLIFNFLNYCYSQIHQHSEKAAGSIEIFSEMLMYTLKAKSEEKVALADEIQFLENFITLQKEVNPKIYLELCFDKEIRHLQVPPLIITSFFESAYKYGKNDSPQNPIFLSIKQDHKNLIVSLTLKIEGKINKDAFNMDLDNMAKLLNLYFDGRNKLINENKGEGLHVITISIHID